MGIMKIKNILSSIIVYLILSTICLFYFIDRANAYELINSLRLFIAYPITLFLALCIFLFLPSRKKKNIFQLTFTFILILGALVLVFELVKPNYTYAEAKKIIELEYNVATVKSDETVLIEGNSNKEIYRIYALENSKLVEFSFNPYSKKIFKLE